MIKAKIILKIKPVRRPLDYYEEVATHFLNKTIELAFVPHAGDYIDLICFTDNSLSIDAIDELREANPLLIESISIDGPSSISLYL